MYYIYIHIQQYLEPQVQLPFNVNVMALLFRSRSGELSLCCLQAVSHAFRDPPMLCVFLRQGDRSSRMSGDEQSWCLQPGT